MTTDTVNGCDNAIKTGEVYADRATLAPCNVSITLRQAGVEVNVGGTDTDLVEATFDALYEKYKSYEGYKGAAPTQKTEEEKNVTATKIARAMAIRKSIAARAKQG